MRLLQAIGGARHGGAEAFFERFAIALDKVDVEQRVVIRRNEARANYLRQNGVCTKQLSFGGRLDIITPIYLKRLISEFKPDLVLTWMNRASCQMPKGDHVSIGRLGGYYSLKYYKKCDHLIGNTQDIVDYLIDEGWPNDRAHYIPNFVSSSIQPAVKRSDHMTPIAVPLLLTMGRLHENKGFDVLLKALTHAPRAYLWIAGAGPEELRLRRQVRALGLKPRVRFLGWRKDIAALMAACDVYVCPSRHEPLGNVILEAWVASKPVIAASSQGPKSLIKDEETGLLAEIDDADELGVQINRLINDHVFGKRLGVAGNAQFVKKFREDIVIPKYLKLFKQILEK